MGRPINKKYFGTGAGNQIKTRFKTGGTEYDGYILSQRSATRFKVTDGSVEAVCKLADKAQGALADGDMTITITDDAGNVKQITKISGHRVTVDTGEAIQWSFDNATNDGAGEIEEEGTDNFE